MNTQLSPILLSVTTFLLLSFSVHAAPIYSFGDAPIFFNDNNVTVGFKFTVNKKLKVDTFGFYDHQQDGLLTSHQVGLFDTHGNLLVSTVVSSGSVGALDGYFRYSSITPFTLTKEESYILAGLATGQDGYNFGNVGSSISGFSAIPEITIAPLSSLYVYAPDFLYPTEFFRYDLYPTVNMQVSDPSPVPVPAALPLFGIGLACLSMVRRRFATLT
jgi:hypothetical protein